MRRMFHPFMERFEYLNFIRNGKGLGQFFSDLRKTAEDQGKALNPAFTEGCHLLAGLKNLEVEIRKAGQFSDKDFSLKRHALWHAIFWMSKHLPSEQFVCENKRDIGKSRTIRRCGRHVALTNSLFLNFNSSQRVTVVIVDIDDRQIEDVYADERISDFLMSAPPGWAINTDKGSQFGWFLSEGVFVNTDRSSRYMRRIFNMACQVMGGDPAAVRTRGIWRNPLLHKGFLNVGLSISAYDFYGSLLAARKRLRGGEMKRFHSRSQGGSGAKSGQPTDEALLKWREMVNSISDFSETPIPARPYYLDMWPDSRNNTLFRMVMDWAKLCDLRELCFERAFFAARFLNDLMSGVCETEKLDDREVDKIARSAVRQVKKRQNEFSDEMIWRFYSRYMKAIPGLEARHEAISKTIRAGQRSAKKKKSGGNGRYGSKGLVRGEIFRARMKDLEKEKRRKVKEAWIRLSLKEGKLVTTITHIAREAGVSRPTARKHMDGIGLENLLVELRDLIDHACDASDEKKPAGGNGRVEDGKSSKSRSGKGGGNDNAGKGEGNDNPVIARKRKFGKRKIEQARTSLSGVLKKHGHALDVPLRKGMLYLRLGSICIGDAGGDIRPFVEMIADNLIQPPKKTDGIAGNERSFYRVIRTKFIDIFSSDRNPFIGSKRRFLVRNGGNDPVREFDRLRFHRGRARGPWKSILHLIGQICGLDDHLRKLKAQERERLKGEMTGMTSGFSICC